MLAAARSPVIDVAAAVVQDAAGRVLLAQRRPDQKSPGYWELPGGKMEPGETPAQSAARELAEEVGVTAGRFAPCLAYEHAFPTRRLRLRFFHALDWRGIPAGREGQQIAWVDPASPGVGPLMPSNARIMRLLALPDRLLVAQAASTFALAQLEALLRRGHRGPLVVRPPALPADGRVTFLRRVLAAGREHGATILPVEAASAAIRAGADGAVSDGRDLRHLQARPPFALWGALCASGEDMRGALALGADFILAEGETPDGAEAPVPVYAVTGQREPGAQGVSLSWWAGRHTATNRTGP